MLYTLILQDAAPSGDQLQLHLTVQLSCHVCGKLREGVLLVMNSLCHRRHLEKKTGWYHKQRHGSAVST